MQHHEQIAHYFRTHGVSVIFLFRRNLLRRMVSVLANQYDRDAKLLNGTHKSHVHSHHEVSLFFSHGCSSWYIFLCASCVKLNILGCACSQRSCLDAAMLSQLMCCPTQNSCSVMLLISDSGFQAEILARYKPTINTTLMISNLNQVNETAATALEYFKSTRHIVMYYEDVVKNSTVSLTTYDPKKDQTN